MLLDDLLPDYGFGEIHSIRIAAPPGAVLEAAKRATPGEMPLVQLLFAVRSLPAQFAGERGFLPAEGTGSLYEQMLASGFVRLAEEPGRELVAGVVGQMWKFRGGSLPALRDAREFVAFGEPGYAKGAMNFSVEPKDGATELRTETRVLTTDPASHRAFGRYWRLIRPGSGAIRRSWLGAAKRRAERGAPEERGDGPGARRGGRIDPHGVAAARRTPRSSCG